MRLGRLIGCAGAVLLQSASGQAQSPEQVPPAAPLPVVPLSVGRIAGGYLSADQMPDSLTIVPPPPAPGSAAQARDDAAAAAAIEQKGSARWALATTDANLAWSSAVGTFSCAAGFALTSTGTPAISRLLRRTMVDFATSTVPTKRKYQRARPFMANGKATCTPTLEPILRRDGSYPSGHSAIGYGTGLVLSEIVPARTAQLVARGRVFGDSRRLCNVHWLSDVEEGRVMATATFARLQSDPAFQSDLAAARAEAQTALTMQAGPARDCAAEAATIAATR